MFGNKKNTSKINEKEESNKNLPVLQYTKSKNHWEITILFICFSYFAGSGTRTKIPDPDPQLWLQLKFFRIFSGVIKQISVLSWLVPNYEYCITVTSMIPTFCIFLAFVDRQAVAVKFLRWGTQDLIWLEKIV